MKCIALASAPSRSLSCGRSMSSSATSSTMGRSRKNPAERPARSSSRPSHSSRGFSGDSIRAKNERPLIRIERASVNTSVIFVNFSFSIFRRFTVNKKLTELFSSRRCVRFDAALQCTRKTLGFYTFYASEVRAMEAAGRRPACRSCRTRARFKRSGHRILVRDRQGRQVEAVSRTVRGEGAYRGL